MCSALVKERMRKLMRLLLFRLATDYQNDGLATENGRRGVPETNQRQRDETSTARSGTDTEGDQDSDDVSPLKSVSDQQFPQLSKMNREVVLKKRKTLRTQITDLVSDAEKKLEENHDPTAMSLIASQIKGIADSLKKADEQMKQFTTPETADSEFAKTAEYELKIISALHNINAYLSRQEVRQTAREQPNFNGEARQPQQATIVKLPKLELMKFDGDKMKWQRLWRQFQTAVHERTDLNENQKFRYLLSSLTGSLPVSDDRVVPVSDETVVPPRKRQLPWGD
ncbi:hypothetical protein HPB49_026348 [Dermacentor silvarum]|nr:hypothetical protein HPB49_026348 [Dermacentor silvarum]